MIFLGAFSLAFDLGFYFSFLKGFCCCLGILFGFVFVFGVAESVLLDLSLGITRGGAREIICGARDQVRVNFMLHKHFNSCTISLALSKTKFLPPQRNISKEFPNTK